MAQPIAVKDGTCFAFPDLLKTVVGPATIVMPYPNLAQLKDASPVADTVKAGGMEVIIETSEIDASTGGEAGTGEAQKNGKCTFTSASGSVFANGKAVVRQFDGTSQNGGNASGTVMSGVSSVMVGG